MSFASMHPSEQIAAIMNRLYRNGLTTLSGGNLSIRDEDGSLWITPAGLGITPTGIDKGNLKPEDVAHILLDGSTEGAQRPSSEYPFHSTVYTRRPDIKAVVHAHSSALVSFCLVHRVPEVTTFPGVYFSAGSVGFVPYALPGSPELAEKIGECFATGVQNVILRNHGIVSGGPDLLTAFQRLEALEYAARIEIKARALGGLVTLTPEQLEIARNSNSSIESNTTPRQEPGENEIALRGKIVEVVRRACGRGLMLSTQGVISARLGADDFLITPHDIDRESLTPGDLVRVSSGKPEPGASPDPSAALHRAIYLRDPEVNSIVSGQPPHIMAYAISTAHFDTRTIPESYTLLVDLPSLPFETPYQDIEAVAGCIGVKQPVVMIRNDRVMAVGRSILQAFDRLEVAETSARSLIESAPLGPLQPIKPEDLDQLTQFIPRL